MEGSQLGQLCSSPRMPMDAGPHGVSLSLVQTGRRHGARGDAETRGVVICLILYSLLLGCSPVGDNIIFWKPEIQQTTLCCSWLHQELGAGLSVPAAPTVGSGHPPRLPGFYLKVRNFFVPDNPLLDDRSSARLLPSNFCRQ